MDITSFDDLLQAARAQKEPQRLLFVFANVELPDDATPAQRTRFAAGQGGTLTPLMCVDKLPDELVSFEALVQEAAQFVLPDQDWGLVFAAALSGSGYQAPSSEATEAALEHMVEAIKLGQIGGYIPFDRHGVPVQLG